MDRVFNAIYKTDNVYAEGYIIFSDDYCEIEGIFALDYVLIYNFNKNTLFSLKSCYWDRGLKYRFDEFSSFPVKLRPNKTFFFYSNTNHRLTLQIQDEVLNAFDIQDILQSLSYIRN